MSNQGHKRTLLHQHREFLEGRSETRTTVFGSGATTGLGVEDLLYAKYVLYHYLKKSLYISWNHPKENANTGLVLCCLVWRLPSHPLSPLRPCSPEEAGRGRHAWVTGVGGRSQPGQG